MRKSLEFIRRSIGGWKTARQARAAARTAHGPGLCRRRREENPSAEMVQHGAIVPEKGGTVGWCRPRCPGGFLPQIQGGQQMGNFNLWASLNLREAF